MKLHMQVVDVRSYALLLPNSCRNVMTPSDKNNIVSGYISRNQDILLDTFFKCREDNLCWWVAGGGGG